MIHNPSRSIKKLLETLHIDTYVCGTYQHYPSNMNIHCGMMASPQATFRPSNRRRIHADVSGTFPRHLLRKTLEKHLREQYKACDVQIKCGLGGSQSPLGVLTHEISRSCGPTSKDMDFVLFVGVSQNKCCHMYTYTYALSILTQDDPSKS